MSEAAKILTARAAAVTGLVLLWELAVRLAGNADLVAPPTAVARAFFADILADAAIPAALRLAFFEILTAYALAVVVGLAVGLAVGTSEIGRRGVYPIVLLLYAIPQVVLLPLFTLIFGIGPEAKIAFGFSHGVFPVIVNTVAGMAGIDPLYVGAARAMGARPHDILRDVVFPHMIASFFTGLRLAMTMTLLGVILAELYVSTAGIGYFTRLYAESFDPAPLFALIATLAVMAILFNEGVRIAERRFTRWKDAP